MKNTNFIFCIVLSLGFINSYAQSSLLDNADINKNTTSLSLVDEIGYPTTQNNIRNPESNISASGDTTAVNDAQVKIYPGPFSGFISVDLKNCPDAKICLYNENGKCVKYMDCANEKAFFNLKNESKGLYFMEIVSNGKKLVSKVNME